LCWVFWGRGEKFYDSFIGKVDDGFSGLLNYAIRRVFEKTADIMVPELVYVLGGTGAGVRRKTNQIYNAKYDSWKFFASMPTNRIS
jgi:hypothetical protein